MPNSSVELGDRRNTVDMDVARVMAGALAVDRTLFGLGYLARPESARTSWIGRSAKKAGTTPAKRAPGSPGMRSST